MNRVATAASAVVFALVTAAEAAAATPVVDQLFVKGETLDYTLTWLGLSAAPRASRYSK